MKIYQTKLTLELLKRHNRIFFNNAKFHGDMGYGILKIGGRNLLRIKTKLTGVVYYEINLDNYQLKYTTL